MKKIIQNWISSRLAVLYGNRFSLDRIFRKRKAVAIIHFVGDEEVSSIRVELRGMTYYFEGTPKIEEYKNQAGKKVIKKTFKYGGWEMNMKHKANKLF